MGSLGHDLIVANPRQVKLITESSRLPRVIQRGLERQWPGQGLTLGKPAIPPNASHNDGWLELALTEQGRPTRSHAVTLPDPQMQHFRHVLLCVRLSSVLSHRITMHLDSMSVVDRLGRGMPRKPALIIHEKIPPPPNARFSLL